MKKSVLLLVPILLLSVALANDDQNYIQDFGDDELLITTTGDDQLTILEGEQDTGTNKIGAVRDSETAEEKQQEDTNYNESIYNKEQKETFDTFVFVGIIILFIIVCIIFKKVKR